MLKKLVVLAVLSNKFIVFLLLFYISKTLGAGGYGHFSYDYAIAAGVAAVVGEALALCLSRYSAQGESDYQLPTVIVCWGAFVGGLFSLLIAWAFPIKSSAMDSSVGAGGHGLAVFLLTAAMIANVSFVGLMFSYKTSAGWLQSLIAHGIGGMVVMAALLSISATPLGAELGMALITFIAPVCAFLILVAARKVSVGSEDWYSIKKIAKLVKDAQLRTVMWTMLFGAPVHLSCVMIFAHAVGADEVGAFNLFFLFYILITVLPASLTAFLMVKLTRDQGVVRLYLLGTAGCAVVGPLILYLSKGSWLCTLTPHFCQREDLVAYAMIAGALGLLTTVIGQILHSRLQSRIVLMGALAYAFGYLGGTAFGFAAGKLSAESMFIFFIGGLTAQLIVFIVWAGFRRYGRRQENA